MSQVLVIDDERGIREGLATALSRQGHRPVTAQGLSEARARLADTANFSCILLDIRLRDGDGLAFLRELRQGPFRDVPVVVATAYDDGPRTIAAMRDGAFDYITKPFDLPRLLSTVARAVSTTRTKSHPPEPRADDDALVGKTPAMHEVWKLIGRASASTVPVLVRGEAGTGKELVARAIHESSGLPPDRLVVLRAADPSVDLERRVREADEGTTLLLDGVGLLDPSAQQGLASVLALGTRARIVATTRDPGAPLDARGMPNAPRLLPELYFHLAVVEIVVPPLRDRRADIPLLAACALAKGPPRTLSEDALAALAVRDFPGNVRELFLVVRRAAALASAETVTVHDLPDDVGERSPASSSRGGASASYEGMPLRDALPRLEKELLTRALHRAEGNRTAAARLLGIARPQLYVKLEEHRIVERKKP